MSSLFVSSRVVRCTDEGTEDLIDDFGTLCHVIIQCNGNGRSLDTAEFACSNRDDDGKAIAQYNGVPLDGRPMQIIQVNPSGGRSHRFIKCNLTGYTC